MIGSCDRLAGYWIDENSETPDVGRVERTGCDCAGGEVGGLWGEDGDLGYGVGGG